MKFPPKNIHSTNDLLIEQMVRPATHQIFSSKMICIWLVDGHDDYRQLQSDMLNAEAGVMCARHCHSAETVLTALKFERAPDVILLDMEMPRSSGLEAIRPILKLAPDTHLVMMGAFFNHSRQEKAFAEGACGFLIKGLAGAEIVAAIKVMIPSLLLH